jgi:hypothetical protein
MAHDVFVSYPSVDKSTADAVVASLESAGLRCWYAPRDVRAGSDWAAAIIDAIESARLMVLVFSEATNSSDHILREVRQAADAHVPIVPFRTTSEQPSRSLEYYIGGTHWLDALSGPIERHLERVVETASELLDGREGGGFLRERTVAPPKPPTVGPDRPTSPSRRWYGSRVVIGGAALVVALFVGRTLLAGNSGFDMALGGLTWVENPGNGHHYAATRAGVSWDEARLLARNLGGHLVSFNDESEATWVYSQFGDTSFWMGLTDEAEEGLWTWTSGEDVTFVRWCGGEPSGASPDLGEEDGSMALPSARCWVDELTWAVEYLNEATGETETYPGVIEIDR